MLPKVQEIIFDHLKEPETPRTGAEIRSRASLAGKCARSLKRIKSGRKPKTMSDAERFEQFIEPEPMSGCLLWLGAMADGTYGFFSLGGKMIYAHRWNYERLRGAISEDMILDHLCRTPCCVNPFHLEVVTYRENVFRGVSVVARQMRQTQCKRGHDLKGENLLKARHPRHRRCRTCTLQRNRASVQRMREQRA